VIDLSLIYTTTGEKPFEMGAELRCQEHPEWWSDADGTNLPDVIKAAQEHVREEHRAHVDGCMCRGNQVIDQRCIPTTAPNPAEARDA
jgi:hypothetical protein